jgi:hypothetical protein
MNGKYFPSLRCSRRWKYSGWGAVSITPTISVPKNCFADRERSPLPLSMSTKKAAQGMKSTPYVARPLTEFQHLASFSSYLLPHDLKPIGNSTFN